MNIIYLLIYVLLILAGLFFVIKGDIIGLKKGDRVFIATLIIIIVLAILYCSFLIY